MDDDLWATHAWDRWVRESKKSFFFNKLFNENYYSCKRDHRPRDLFLFIIIFLILIFLGCQWSNCICNLKINWLKIIQKIVSKSLDHSLVGSVAHSAWTLSLTETDQANHMHYHIYNSQILTFSKNNLINNDN